MNKRSKKAYRKKLVEERTQPRVSEGCWEEAMLENGSYYDIKLLNRANRPILREIEKWEEKKKQASSWIGKWFCQLKINKLNSKLHKYK